jgi:hypothetical protein
MNAVWVVLKKELLDLFRDRRTMMISLLMGPLLGPALMIGIITLIATKETERAEKPLELPVIGVEHAPNLIDWLSMHNIVVEAAPADPDAAILNQDEDVILRISEDFGADWRGSEPATVEILHDSTRQDARIPVRRIESLLEGYSAQVGAMRLLTRGVHPAVGTPLQITHRDLSTPESRSGMILAFLPYFLILGGFLGGAQLAMDATAGERERQAGGIVGICLAHNLAQFVGVQIRLRASTCIAAGLQGRTRGLGGGTNVCRHRADLGLWLLSGHPAVGQRQEHEGSAELHDVVDAAADDPEHDFDGLPGEKSALDDGRALAVAKPDDHEADSSRANQR